MSPGPDIVLVSHRHSREALLGDWFIGFSTLHDRANEKKWCYSFTANMRSGSPGKAILQNLQVIPAQKEASEYVARYVNRHKQVQLDEFDFGLLATVPKTYGCNKANIEAHVIKIFAGMNHTGIDRVQFCHYAYIEHKFPLEELTRIVRIALNPLLNNRFRYIVFDIDSRHIESMRNLVDKIHWEYHQKNYNSGIIYAPEYTCVDQQCESEGNRWVMWAAKLGFDLTSPSKVIPDTVFKPGSMEQSARSELIRYVTTVKTERQPIKGCSKQVWVCPESVWQDSDGRISALVAVNLTAVVGPLANLLGLPDGNLVAVGAAPDSDYLCQWCFINGSVKGSLQTRAAVIERHEGAKQSLVVVKVDEEKYQLTNALVSEDMENIYAHVRALADKCSPIAEPFYLTLID